MAYTVFTSFKQTPYTFLKLREGETGNEVVQEYDAYGVFKLRRGVTNGQDNQNAISTSTLHIKPTEAFLEGLTSLETHGIRYNGSTYRIVNYTNGMNFHSNLLEHITLTLEAEAQV